MDWVQDKLICVLEAAVAVRFEGAVGTVLLGGGAVELELLHPERPTESRRVTTAKGAVFRAQRREAKERCQSGRHGNTVGFGEESPPIGKVI